MRLDTREAASKFAAHQDALLAEEALLAQFSDEQTLRLSQNGCQPGPYLEARTTQGALRDPYRKLQRELGFSPLNPPLRLRRILSNAPLRDGIKICPVPLVLPQKEILHLNAGSRQIARALARFFADVVLGKAEICRHEVVPHEIVEIAARLTPHTLRELRQMWNNKTANHIVFVCGPDLMRAPSGEWRVIEVNVSKSSEDMGGVADGLFLHQAYKRALQGRRIGSLDRLSGMVDVLVISDVLLHFLHRSGAGYVGTGDMEHVSALSNHYFNKRRPTKKDCEDLRNFVLRHLAKEQIAPFTRALDRRGSGLDFDCEVRQQILAGENLGAFWGELSPQLFTALDTKCANPPGVGAMLSNKILLPYIPRMIRYYLRQAPILAFQPTRALQVQPADNKKGFETRPASALLEEYPAGWHDQERQVFKRVDDCGGSGIFFPGDTHGNRELAAAVRGCHPQHLSDPGYYVAQPFLCASRLGRWAVDVRPISYWVGDGGAVSTDTPWGRARAIQQNYANKDKLLNVARGARELLVISDQPGQFYKSPRRSVTI
ncbi:MAG: circularly permuted type 2 ATP-grasp protein [Oligoflexia bacterium]|nr:circularly permuted type 2 ATP-grasp protein [Oligoflexia bacterium]